MDPCGGKPNKDPEYGMQRLEVMIEQLESAVVIHAVGAVDSTTAATLQEPLLHAAESRQIDPAAFDTRRLDLYNRTLGWLAAASNATKPMAAPNSL